MADVFCPGLSYLGLVASVGASVHDQAIAVTATSLHSLNAVLGVRAGVQNVLLRQYLASLPMQNKSSYAPLSVVVLLLACCVYLRHLNSATACRQYHLEMQGLIQSIIARDAGMRIGR